ncbi:glycosyltransferase family 4 protein [Syntrophomonas curvata]
MSILNLGTYPPKQCGIATFSADLRRSLIKNNCDVKVMAVSDESYKYAYPDEVLFNLQQHNKQDYVKAAKFINSAAAVPLVIVQHEYGIYGGEDGDYLLELVRRLHKPYVVVTHTVLPQPSKHQKQVLNQLCHHAAAVVGMTRKSAGLLADLYEAPAELIHVIPHGVPDFKKQNSNCLKKKYGFEGREIISTFGLIGPGKGLELGIEAISGLVPEWPSLCYLVLGQTHPMLKQYEGEKYRHMLEQLVHDLGLTNNVRFVNKYLSDEEIGEYLYMSDIYLSPYPNKDQAVSGTTAFAVGCGRAIVSTAYAYASEVLAGKRGLLAQQPEAQELSGLIRSILMDQALKSRLQNRAQDLGKSWTWFNVGQQYKGLFKQVLNKNYLEEHNLGYGGF